MAEEDGDKDLGKQLTDDHDENLHSGHHQQAAGEVEADGFLMPLAHSHADQGHHALGNALHDHEDHQAQVGDDSVNGLVALAKETEEDVVVNDGEKAQHKFDGAVRHPQREDPQENLGRNFMSDFPLTK